MPPVASCNVADSLGISVSVTVSTCREFSQFILDYTSGELPADVLATFERHLSRCTNCRRYLLAYEESVKLGRRAFDDDETDVPSGVLDQLVDAILSARRQ